MKLFRRGCDTPLALTTSSWVTTGGTADSLNLNPLPEDVPDMAASAANAIRSSVSPLIEKPMLPLGPFDLAWDKDCEYVCLGAFVCKFKMGAGVGGRIGMGSSSSLSTSSMTEKAEGTPGGDEDRGLTNMADMERWREAVVLLRADVVEGGVYDCGLEDPVVEGPLEESGREVIPFLRIAE
ncbi:hypothetical protein JR316_0006358 [Psilocybe cubensis]|uniref:Uncharacterized protein n=1 Tax=Psilocybe cubensis TaxID=181762 RepID=A0ACB8H225_PSICU|nr:hypothetical protein JR316_0006358 [Psilocybe cubensis]KAH9481828.1 hypothetical protein JR316_0006358 [Psilocybe cubensis]